MLKSAMPAAVALVLITFAARSQATDADAQGSIAPMGWYLSHEGSLAKLAYGVESSDQLAMMLTGEPGAAEATVYGEVRPAGPRPVRISTASAIDPLSGGLADEMRISLRDPALQRLATGGRLAVQAEAGGFELSASRAERRLIGDFFAYCGSYRV